MKDHACSYNPHCGCPPEPAFGRFGVAATVLLVVAMACIAVGTAGSLFVIAYWIGMALR